METVSRLSRRRVEPEHRAARSLGRSTRTPTSARRRIPTGRG